MRSRTFRIFLSSTFSDFEAERKALHEKVWPELEEHCKAHGASFEVVDLRWGILEAEGNSHETLRICLDEIANCQQLSPKPNFLLMVGNRYGWRPVPSEIPEEKFDGLLSLAGPCSSDDHKLLMSAYQLDENALPHHYCLKPKGANWSDIESKLSALLREIEGCDYLLSATHLEIIKGALNGPVAHDHVFGFVRDIEGLEINSEQAKIYTDITKAGVPDDEASKLLDQLRGKIKTIPEEHRYEHSVQWKQGTEAHLGTEYIEQLCHRVQAFLLNIIDQELSQPTSDPFDQELQHHRDFSAERLKMFMGRTDELAKVREWALSAIASDGGLPLIVHGPGGIGKSAFMAKVAAEIEDLQPDTEVIQRFIGASPQSSGFQSFLGDLLREVARQYKQDEALPEGGLNELIEELPKRLSWATADKPLLLVIDALDQFEATTFEARHHEWLPKTMPAHVAVVLSVLDGEIANAVISRYPKAEALALPPLGREDGREILDALLFAGDLVAAERKRKLTDNQYAVVLKAFEQNGRPLFLSLAAGIVRRWKSWERPEPLPNTIEGLVECIVKNLRDRHGQIMADRALDYLAASRFGVSDKEILGLLWADAEAHDEFKKEVGRTKQDDELSALPPIIWSRIYFELAPYLAPPQSIDGALLHRFFHRIIGETAEKVSLTSDKALVHGRIANYFANQPSFIGKGPEKTPNLRKLMEEPWQWIQAGKYDEAEALLTNFDFAMAKCNANRLSDLLEDFRWLVKAKRDAGQEISKDLSIWQRFMYGKAHLLLRAVPEWTADRILLQLAVEHADDSPVTIAAERWLGGRKPDWIWLRDIERPALMPRDPCLAVLEDIRLRNVMVLKSGGILLLSDDGFLFSWEGVAGTPPFPIKGQNEPVVVVYADGSRIIASSEDGSMYIWDGKSDWPKAMEGHTDQVFGVKILDDGRILSWSADRTLCLWDGKSKHPQVTMVGHTAAVRHAEILKDGRVLSWSVDKTLRIWSGHPYSPAGKAEPIWSARIINPHRILTWTSDKCLRTWDGHAPEPLKTTHVLPEVSPFLGPELYWAAEVGNGNLEWYDNGTSNYLDMSINGSSEHLGKFTTVEMLDDGRIISVSPGSVCLWDISSGAPSILHGAYDDFTGAVGLADGHALCLWCSRSSELLLWDGKSEGLMLPMKGHTGSVRDVRVLDDGRILSWAADGTLCLWDGKSEGPILSMKGHTGSVRDVRVLDDGRILSWSEDGTLCIWDGESDQPKAKMNERTGPIEGAEIFNDGRIIFWSKDGTLYVWDGKSEWHQPPMKQHTQQIKGVKILDDGRTLSWSSDRTLRIWDTGPNRPEASREWHAQQISGVEFANDRSIIYWSDTGPLSVWSGKSGDDPVTIMKDTGGNFKAKLLADGRFLFWSDTGILGVWSGKSGDDQVTTRKVKGSIRGAMLLADGRFIFWSDTGILGVWSGKSGDDPVTIMEDTGVIFKVRLLDDGRFLFWSDTVTLSAWSGKSGDDPVTTRKDTGRTHDAMLLDDGRFIFWSNTGPMSVWSGKSGDDPVTIMEDTGVIFKVRLLADGRFLFVSYAGILGVWSGKSGDDQVTTRKVKGSIRGAMPLADGRFLFWSDTGPLSVWSGKSGDDPVTIMKDTGGNFKAKLLADGRFLFWSDTGILGVWSGKSGDDQVTTRKVKGSIRGAMLLADGRFIFWSDTGILGVWSGKSGDDPVTIPTKTGPIRRPWLLADGRFLFWSDTGTLHVQDGLIESRSSKTWHMPKGACVLLDIESGAPEFVEWVRMRPLPRQNQAVAWLNDSPEAPKIFGYEEDLLVISTKRSFRFLRLMHGNHPIGSLADAQFSNPPGTVQ